MYNDFKEYMCDINLNAKTDLENVNDVFQLSKRRDKRILKETITIFMLTSRYDLIFLPSTSPFSPNYIENDSIEVSTDANIGIETNTETQVQVYLMQTLL